MLKMNRNNKLLIIIFCFCISLLILMITSKSSFLYPFNDWGDANAFFTMGKSLFNGKIIFKDIFEQKGPFLYFIYGIGYVLSNRSFLGVFFLEVISSTIFSYYIFKIVNLYLDKKFAFIIMPIFLSLLYSSMAFSSGGSCEEFCFPLLGYTIYQLLLFNRDGISYRKMYTVGIIAGIIFLMKYTMLGVSFGFALYIFIAILLKKEIKRAFALELVFLCGMLTAFMPWLIYFLLNGALFDFFNTYILINASSYGVSNTPIIERIYNCFYFFLRNLFGTGKHIFILFGGILLFLFRRKYVDKKDKFAVFCLMFFSILFIYIGGTYLSYYVLPMQIFLIFSLIGICLLIRQDIKTNKIIYIISMVLSILLSYYITPNSNFMKVDKKEMPQYQFAKIINENKGSTILNYGALDLGFYTVTGIVPNTKYFEKLNFRYEIFPQNVDCLNSYIDNKQVDFVIFIEGPKNKFPVTKSLEINYEKIASYSNKNIDKVYSYYLYKLKEL